MSHFITFTFVNLCIRQVHHVLVQVVGGLHFAATCEGLAEKVGSLKAYAAHHHITGDKVSAAQHHALLLDVLDQAFVGQCAGTCWAIRTAFHTLKYAISIYFPGRSTGMQECENGFPNSNHSLGMKTPCSPSLSSLCACHRRKLLHVVGHEPNIAHRDGVAVMLHLFRPAFRQPAARCFVELLPSQELLDVGLGVVLVFLIPRLDEVQVVNCLASTSVPGEAGSKTRHSQEEGATHR